MVDQFAYMDQYKVEHNHFCQQCLQIDIEKLKLACNLCGYFCTTCIEENTTDNEFICPFCTRSLFCYERLPENKILQLVQISRQWIVQEFCQYGSITNLYELIFCKDVSYKVQTACARKLLNQITMAYKNRSAYKTTIKPSARSGHYTFKTVPFGQTQMCVIVEPLN